MDVPKHIAVIMDGNGRWANERNLPRVAGHKKGIERVEEIVSAAAKNSVSFLTMFAFSTENWSRPKAEIDFLFSLIDAFIDQYQTKVMKENIRFLTIGNQDRINPRLLKRIKELSLISEKNTGLTLIMAFDYGGRWDIINAVKKIIAADIKPEQIDEQLFSQNLALGNIPDPDLLIRTSGEQRISNFLLWNLAYTEFYFPKICWPDFGEKEFDLALNEYSQRQRKYGAVIDHAK